MYVPEVSLSFNRFENGQVFKKKVLNIPFILLYNKCLPLQYIFKLDRTGDTWETAPRKSLTQPTQ